MWLEFYNKDANLFSSLSLKNGSQGWHCEESGYRKITNLCSWGRLCYTINNITVMKDAFCDDIIFSLSDMTLLCVVLNFVTFFDGMFGCNVLYSSKTPSISSLLAAVLTIKYSSTNKLSCSESSPVLLKDCT